MNIEKYGADRSALLSLFALADDSHSNIAGYFLLGEVLVAREGGAILGHVQIVPSEPPATFEIKSLAVDEAQQGKGIGRALIGAAIAYCREQDARRLIVSTATADIGNLRFYQRQGFRMYRIVQDAFGPTTGYAEDIVIDGIPLRDQIYLECTLGD